MEAVIYNQKGEKSGKINLPDNIFNVKVNDNLIHQVAVSQMANRRQGTAHAKDRSEVSGGGRKPWRQKGTGRARHGSNRSPIWIGGGVTFGPRKEKKYSQKILKKMRRKALFGVLSRRLKEGRIIILDKFEPDGRTKKAVSIIKKIPVDGKILFASGEHNQKTVLSIRNIKGVSIIEARELNVLDILKRKFLVLTKNSVNIIEKTFLGEKEEEKTKERKEEKKEEEPKGENKKTKKGIISKK